jgi:hypothetical protein
MKRNLTLGSFCVLITGPSIQYLEMASLALAWTRDHTIEGVVIFPLGVANLTDSGVG